MTINKAYLAAEFDYHMMYKRADMINYLTSLYKLLDKHGLMDYSDYPKELFDVEESESSGEVPVADAQA
jgi:hypothetical protein